MNFWFKFLKLTNSNFIQSVPLHKQSVATSVKVVPISVKVVSTPVATVPLNIQTVCFTKEAVLLLNQ